MACWRVLESGRDLSEHNGLLTERFAPVLGNLIKETLDAARTIDCDCRICRRCLGPDLAAFESAARRSGHGSARAWQIAKRKLRDHGMCH